MLLHVARLQELGFNSLFQSFFQYWWELCNEDAILHFCGRRASFNLLFPESSWLFESNINWEPKTSVVLKDIQRIMCHVCSLGAITCKARISNVPWCHQCEPEALLPHFWILTQPYCYSLGDPWYVNDSVINQVVRAEWSLRFLNLGQKPKVENKVIMKTSFWP